MIARRKLIAGAASALAFPHVLKPANAFDGYLGAVAQQGQQDVGGGGLTVSENGQPYPYDATQGKQVAVTADSGDLLVAWCLNGANSSSTFTPTGGGLTWAEQYSDVNGPGVYCHTATANGSLTVTFDSSNPSWADPNVCGVLTIKNAGPLGESGFSVGWGEPSVSINPTAGSVVLMLWGISLGGTFGGWIGTGTLNEMFLETANLLGSAYYTEVEAGTNLYGASTPGGSSHQAFVIEVTA